jgi:CRP/FNR family transcriptional regulator, cyclic AMP receptor protein
VTGRTDQPTTASAIPAQQAGQEGHFIDSLATDQRLSLLQIGAMHGYKPGQVIMREGAPADIVIVITQGLAKIVVVSEGGKEVLLSLRGTGDLVGEMAVLSRRRRSATVIAATVLKASVIRADSFVAYLERNPRLANQVSDNVADKLRMANRSRLEYNSYPAQRRVALVLGEVALAYLASLASTSVRTIEKVLSVLEADVLVSRRRRDLVVTDLAALLAHGKS